MQYINEMFNHYGYIVLLVALMSELMALPLPGEVLMCYCGFLVFQGKLNWILSIFIASTGAILGVTMSYFIGRILGVRFFQKYGKYIHLGSEKLDKTSEWFERYGNKLIIFAYFIPGVRHITGYFSGITRISFSKFVVRAYIGAILWTATFVSLGKGLGSNWEQVHTSLSKSVFEEVWNNIEKLFSVVTASMAIALFSLLIFLCVLRKYSNAFLTMIILGGEIIEEGLRCAFHPAGSIKESLIAGINDGFPTEQTFIAIVIYGLVAFMISRKAKLSSLKKIITIGALVACFIVGVSLIFLQIRFPSNVASGYAFGGVWLSLNIVLLEVFRILLRNKKQQILN